MRYLTDPTQTPNSRVKIATLVFITQIAETAEPSALINSAGTALARLLDWSNDVKSQDVRRHAQNAVISLYNLNPPKVTMILAELPKYYQVRRCIYIYTHVYAIYMHRCVPLYGHYIIYTYMYLVGGGTAFSAKSLEEIVGFE